MTWKNTVTRSLCLEGQSNDMNIKFSFGNPRRAILIMFYLSCNYSSWQAEEVQRTSNLVSTPIWPQVKNLTPPQLPLTQQYMFHPPPFGFFFNFWVLSCWKEGVGVGMFMLKGMLKHKILAAPKRHFNIVLLSFEQKDKYCRSTWNI